MKTMDHSSAGICARTLIGIGFFWLGLLIVSSGQESQMQVKGNIEKSISEYPKALSLRLTGSSANRERQSLTDALAIEKKGDPTHYHNYWIRKAVDWRMAIAQHNPGELDAAVATVGNWPINDLEIIVHLVKELTLNPTKQFRHKKLRVLKEVGLTKKDIAPKLNLTDDPNQVLKRGALLHADIAMLQLETGGYSGYFCDLLQLDSGNDNGYIPNRSLVDDSRRILENGGWHLYFARLLLDSVSPNPSSDEMVGQWYIATSAFMLARRNRAYAELNLTRALEIFPSDARILFYTGVLHESYAAPKSQNALAPTGTRFQYGSKKSELKLARKFLNKAIAADPKFSEAHLHLGRVMGLLGDHDRAVAELRQATGAITDPQLEYYVSLCLGNEFAQLNRRDEARVHYKRAATLYPAAQTPLLGLSQLAHSGGDVKRAVLAVQQVFGLLTSYTALEDPWWNYDLSHVRNEPTLVSEMRKVFGELLLPD